MSEPIIREYKDCVRKIFPYAHIRTYNNGWKRYMRHQVFPHMGAAPIGKGNDVYTAWKTAAEWVSLNCKKAPPLPICTTQSESSTKSCGNCSHFRGKENSCLHRLGDVGYTVYTTKKDHCFNWHALSGSSPLKCEEAPVEEGKLPLIIAVDFDGTLCKDCFPNIGEPNQRLFRKLSNCQSGGHKIVLWTCRTGKYLVDAVYWCAERGLRFDAINEDISHFSEVVDGKVHQNRKIYADIYIDDRAETVRW